MKVNQFRNYKTLIYSYKPIEILLILFIFSHVKGWFTTDFLAAAIRKICEFPIFSDVC